MENTIQHIWLTAKEAADYLRISIKTLYNLRVKGHLGGHRVGGVGKILFSRGDLDNFITSRAPKNPKRKSA